jgi:hypothetical protein
MANEHQVQILSQIQELNTKYPGFVFEAAVPESNALGDLSGTVCFHATYDGTGIYDEYRIRVHLNSSYPQKPPSIFEIGDRISSSHHRYTDGSLCLAAPLRVRMEFASNPTLLGFFEALVIPYLYSYSYFQRYGRMPYGELSHHGKGILEFYSEFMGFSSPSRILKMLAAVYQRSRWRHLSCPCGSGRYLRVCHLPEFKSISRHSTKEDIRYEAIQILLSWKSMGLHPSSIPRVFANMAKEAKRTSVNDTELRDQDSLRSGN